MKVEPDSRVRDLSRPGGRLVAEVEASEASEVLVSMCVLAGEEDYSTYDVGAERLAAARDRLSPELRADVADLYKGYEKIPAHLLGLTAETAKPRTFAAFMDHIEDVSAAELYLHLLGYYMGSHRPVEADRIEAAANGDDAARREFLDAGKDWPDWELIYSNLFRLGADEVAARIRSLLPRWHEEAFLPFRDEAMTAIEADAAVKLDMLTTTPPERMAELVTSGYRYTPGPQIHRLIFFPSYLERPWVLLGEHKQTKIFCYPAAVAPEIRDAPTSEALARLYKALGDEGRLRVLKLLRSGPVSLAQATETLGVAKSTAHHHLSILRHAGLVLIQDSEGKDRTEYSLRDDLLPGAGDLLRTYLDA
jgi:DNA-binding transcriptional ArsR family regulator